MFLSKSSSLRLSMTSTTSVSAGGRTAEFLKAHVSVTGRTLLINVAIALIKPDIVVVSQW